MHMFKVLHFFFTATLNTLRSEGSYSDPIAFLLGMLGKNSVHVLKVLHFALTAILNTLQLLFFSFSNAFS